MKFDEDFWGNVITFFITLACIVIFAVIIRAFTADHKVRGYYLNSTCNNNGASPKIVVDIDWQADESIVLDRYTTYPQAIQMLDSLNATLKK